ncbi:MAG: adenylate/guanylate cyclase domain-containing protein [Gallionellaceae bacterium]|nr:MAG: adenylate/guanylate cyclase domain-containing protein [Gallionellaceae bacterium]
MTIKKISKINFSGKAMKAVSLLLAFLSILAVTLLYYTQNPFLEAFEAKTYDLRYKSLRGPIAPHPDIAIIAIDDKSIAELGRFPWTRTEYAHLISRLSDAGAKRVLFDAFFPEHEASKPDRAFAEAIKKAGNIVLAMSFDLDKDFRVGGVTRSIPEIERNAAGIGHINFLPESDGVNRRSMLVIQDAEGKFTPSLGLVGAMAALGEKEFTANPYDIAVGEHHIPVSADYAMWINYTGNPGVYPRYSFTDVAHGRIAPELLKGKILFVGATALGVYDMRVTPFHGNTPGVEVHATIADNIISERYIRQTGFESLIDILFILLLGSLSYYLTTKLRLYSAIPAAFLMSAGYIWLSYRFFLDGHWVSMVYPPLAAVVAVLVGGSFRYLVLDRSARQMRSMFSSYLSDKLVARLEENPDAAKIGGDNKEVTVLFTDVKSFTSFSEKHTPQEVVARLNEYLGAMVQVVERFDGTVDKFIGDGILIYWGAPLAQPDHAKLAIECIKAMRKRMEELREKWKADGVEPFYIRGGVQSGEVVAGNVGFEGKKMEYTVIGDTVNQAARLESSAKYYGINFLVGESTHKLTGGEYAYRELDRIRVVGKQLPVTIYEPVGFSAGIDEKMAERFNSALELYRARQWEESRNSFRSILAEAHNDRPCEIYIERCDFFEKNPPPETWDGVFTRDEK